jgi:organic hydroperoxide reductase OsmC/OhrA
MDHDYRLQLHWTGETARYESYDRTFRVAVAGKPPLAGSADPVFRGHAALHNPEDLFVAAIASCHLLSYLALCARAGVRVLGYVDDAHGRMVTRGGGGRFEQVTLRPRVVVADGADVARALALHADAHAQCFIASSCSVPIACDASVTMGVVRREPARRWDLAVQLANRPGALAELGETLGRAGVSLEGGGGFVVGDACVVHFLVGDGERAASTLRAVGLEVLRVCEVVEVRLRQDEPGQLGTLARAMADAGVNIECVYSDHDHQLILCVDDADAARRIAASWRAVH